MKKNILYKIFEFHSVGNIQRAEKYYQLFINQGYEDYRVFSNKVITEEHVIKQTSRFI